MPTLVVRSRLASPVAVALLGGSILMAGCERRPGGVAGGGSSTARGASSSTAVTTSPSPARRSAGVARLFARLPSRDSIGWRPLGLGKSALAVRQPPGWQQRLAGGELRLRAGDKSAAVVLRLGSKPPTKRALARLLDWMGVAEVSWGEPASGTWGAARLPATVRPGTANLGERDAEAWRLDADEGGEPLMAIAVVARGAEDERRALLDCLRTLHRRRQ